MNTEEIAIRPVQDEDFPAITEIYNYYVLKGEQSFETEAVTAEEMQQRAFIITIDSHYLVAVSGGTILGFCYAHKWKERLTAIPWRLRYIYRKMQGIGA